MLIFSIIFVVILLFGVKEIAKIVLLFFIAGSFFSNFILVSNAMGFVGFIALALIITSFYLQGNISVKALRDDARYLFINTRGQSAKLLNRAENEVKSVVIKAITKKGL